MSANDDFYKKLGIDSLQALDLLTRHREALSHRTAGLRVAGRDAISRRWLNAFRRESERARDSRNTPLMLDLRQYQCLGEALRAAMERWPDEVCLIEADRDRENARYTYAEFSEAALPLASAMQKAGLRSGTARRCS